MTAPSRRQVLIGGVAFGAGIVATESGRRLWESDPSDDAAASVGGRSAMAAGDTQAGVDRPLTPPTHLHFQAFSLREPGRLGTSAWSSLLASIGTMIDELVEAARADGSGTLTVQIGVGQGALAEAVAPTPPDVTLPSFLGTEALAPAQRGGDLFVLVAAERPETALAAVDSLFPLLADFRPRWSQIGFRPRGEGLVARNPFGFQDGIVQPAFTDGTPADVWLEDGPWRGATIGVARRFELDVAAFAALDEQEQERVFGRTRAEGAPLSGGGPADDIDLGAKTPDGEYLVPADSHARAAHPSFTGSTLMLRRSYGFRNSSDGGPDTAGLLFLSYQNDVAVFSRTQSRMDRVDRLMQFVAPTAEAAFLVLPGFSSDRPLGSTIFGAAA